MLSEPGPSELVLLLIVIVVMFFFSLSIPLSLSVRVCCKTLLLFVHNLSVYDIHFFLSLEMHLFHFSFHEDKAVKLEGRESGRDRRCPCTEEVVAIPYSG